MKQFAISGFFLLLTLALFSGTAAVAQSFYPIITPSAYYVLPGTGFSVTGARFAPGENILFSAFGNEPRQITADNRGRFSVSGLTAPFGVKSLTVSAYGAVSQANIVRTLTVGTYYPVVKAAKYHLIPGGSVEFTGTGFAPGEEVGIIQNGKDVGVLTAADGSFTKTFKIPYATSNLTFEFKGSLSGASAKATVKVATLAKPWLKLSSYYLRSGSRLVISGKGFGANEEVALAYEGVPLGSPTANDKGEFTFTTTVPEGSPGRKLIEAKGLLTGVAASEKLTKAGLVSSR